MDNPVRIAVRLPDSGYMGRILLGALRAAHARKWIVGVGENAPDYMLRCGVQGIIGAPGDEPSPAQYAKVGLPFVRVLGFDVPGCLSAVELDHGHVGRLAGEHLLECGFVNFAYVGYPHHHGLARRREFERVVQPRARTFSVCPVAYNNTPEDFDAMLAWLRALPKPAGIFAADDPVGSAVTGVCHLGGLRVPADVAVISVNDDGVHTLASEPELSSIRVPWERIGAEAVGVLARHVVDGSAESQVVVVAPTGISVRRSSDVSVIADPEVATAAAFIREHLHVPIGVDDVVDATRIGRRLLERRYKGVTGRTLLEQIQVSRIDRAKRLLVETTDRVSDISAACGFGSRAQFHRLFFKRVGTTPDLFRRAQRDVVP